MRLKLPEEPSWIIVCTISAAISAVTMTLFFTLFRNQERNVFEAAAIKTLEIADLGRLQVAQTSKDLQETYEQDRGNLDKSFEYMRKQTVEVLAGIDARIERTEDRTVDVVESLCRKDQVWCGAFQQRMMLKQVLRRLDKIEAQMPEKTK